MTWIREVHLLHLETNPRHPCRAYWSNPATGLVNDVPGEIMLHPSLSGTARFAD